MFDLVELFTHWRAGRSQVQLSESLGIDRKTIRKYLAPVIRTPDMAAVPVSNSVL